MPLSLGSFNYTEPANLLNDENIMVIGSLHEGDPESIDKQRQLVAYALQEIERIITLRGEGFDPDGQ